jgi:hypothetical protein
MSGFHTTHTDKWSSTKLLNGQRFSDELLLRTRANHRALVLPIRPRPILKPVS